MNNDKHIWENWKRYELYPSIFGHLNSLLPELDLQPDYKGWHSNKKLFGRTAKENKTKINIYKNSLENIHLIEWGEPPIALIDYIIQRDGKEYFEILKYLANYCNIQLPKSQYNDFTDYETAKDKESRLLTINEYFKYLLIESEKGGSKRDEVLEYLKGGRDYDKETITNLGLGYVPNRDRALKHLKDFTKCSETDAKETIDSIYTDSRIGKEYKLAIPYFSGGKLLGYCYRLISEPTASDPKYLYTRGLQKSKNLFNLKAIKGDKDLIIVEGLIDASHCEAKGLENVVALGSNAITADAIQEAIKRGAKRFTICLDIDKKDNAQKFRAEANLAIIDKIIPHCSEIFIAEIPPSPSGDKVDPDTYIATHGINEFKKIINNAIIYYDYYVNNVIEKYKVIASQQDNQQLTAKQFQNFQNELILTAGKITNPAHKDLYYNAITTTTELGITAETFKAVDSEIKYNAAKEAKQKEINNAISKVSSLNSSGDLEGCITVLKDTFNTIGQIGNKDALNELLKPITRVEIASKLVDKPEGLTTSFIVDDKNIKLPAGAISIIVAPTSHGKTTFLNNMIIDVAKLYPNKQFYFFSFEESRESLVIKSLNTYVKGVNRGGGKSNIENIERYLASGDTKYFTQKEIDATIKEIDGYFDLLEANRINIQYCNYTSDQLIEAIKYLKDNTNLGGVFIDYIQLINLPKGKNKTYSRQEEMKQICIDLKDAAVDTGIPIVLAAQFNRQVVNIDEIHATNLGEAGDIERVANLIIGLYNTNFSQKGLTAAQIKAITDTYKDVVNERNKLFAKILKNRDGEAGKYTFFQFDGGSGTVENANNLGEYVQYKSK